jgi:Family of unknown function (DUF5947)
MNREGNPPGRTAEPLVADQTRDEPRPDGSLAESAAPMSEMATGLSSLSRSLTTLRNLSPRRKPVVRCEMCSQPLPEVHQHLVEIAPQRLICVCDACSLLFSNQGAEQKYRRVPRRSLFLPDFRLSDSQWDSLLIPINMAFFFPSTPQGRVVALYPSPAGAMESLLELDSWNEIVDQNAVLQAMEPDVEALLVNRIGRLGHQGPAASYRDSAAGAQEALHFLAPLDECYKLVGVIRANWRGFSGGKKVWDEIDGFFVDLRARSTTRREPLEQGPKQCPT